MTAEEMLNLGIMYFNGEIVPQDFDKAFMLFKQAEDLDFREVYRWLGMCYLNKYGTAQDFKMAYHYFELALEFNSRDTETMYLLAECSYAGIGVTKNVKEFFELNLQAAKFGYHKSFHKLAFCYRTGSGVEKDLGQALYWAEKCGYQEWINQIKKEIDIDTWFKQIAN